MCPHRKPIEKIIPLLLFILFVAITLPGISWGTPELWHPDEQVKIADRAIRGITIIDSKNFNQPSLAKYTMYWIGRLVYRLGGARGELIIASRALSVFLGSAVVLLTYCIAQICGASPPFALLAAFFVIFSDQMAMYARFAHTDIYMVFFSILSVAFLLKYRLTGNRLWLYASFLGVGLSASSKYNGASMILAVLIVFLVTEWPKIAQDKLRFLETLTIGLGLTFVGFVIGTPRMLLSMSFYIPRALKTLFYHSTYGYQTGDRIGLLGQWSMLVDAWGMLEFAFFLAAVLWAGLMLSKSFLSRGQGASRRKDLLGVLLLCLLAADLPVLVSYNYQERFLLHWLPLLSVIASLFLQEIYALAVQTGRKSFIGLVIALPMIILLVGCLRVISIDLLFFNDSRIAASRFIETLPKGSSIEYTLYEPIISDKKFKKFNYPIVFQDNYDEDLSEDKSYQWNQGEEGIESRRPDYFIADSITSHRFDNPFICESIPNECAFFERLLAGKTNYQLIRKFEYRLPPFLPQLKPGFLNPDILVFQRRPGQ